jgi:hypothetical protein
MSRKYIFVLVHELPWYYRQTGIRKIMVYGNYTLHARAIHARPSPTPCASIQIHPLVNIDVRTGVHCVDTGVVNTPGPSIVALVQMMGAREKFLCIGHNLGPVRRLEPCSRVYPQPRLLAPRVVAKERATMSPGRDPSAVFGLRLESVFTGLEVSEPAFNLEKSESEDFSVM